MKVRWFAWRGVAALLVATALIGGGPTAAMHGPGHPASVARAQAKKPRVAFITINMQDQFFVQLNQGIQAAAAKQGVEALLYDPNGEAIKQVDAIDTYINDKVDAIIVDAIDAKGIVPALKKARDAGIPIIAVDAVVDNPVVTAQVGTNDEDASRQIGQYCAAYVDKSLEGKAQVGVIEAKQSQLQLVRTRGFEAGLQAHPGIKVVQEVDGGYAPDTSLTAAETLLTGNPDLHLIYGTGEPALLGAMAAAKSQGRTDLKICGWGLTDQIATGVEQGTILVTVWQNPAALGVAAVDTAVKLANKASVPHEVLVPVTLVTTANLKQSMAELHGAATPGTPQATS